MSAMRLLSFIYEKVTDLRNTLYDRGVFHTASLNARVISIGNLTTGGTGKTPLTALVANSLSAHGSPVCILTRGYGRKESRKRVLVSDGKNALADADAGGDEPVELARNLQERAIVIADADRLSAGEWAVRRFGTAVFVLDDGFQHRKLKRDLDIVCIDATDPFGGGELLPAGRLREPLKGLQRADIAMITRADLVRHIDTIKADLLEINPKLDIFTCRTRIKRLIGSNDAANNGEQLAAVHEGRSYAFCGIGNPESFFELLRRGGYTLADTQIFKDHHRFTEDDIERIADEARLSGASALLTTAKDAERLRHFELPLPCFVVETEIEIDRCDDFVEMLRSKGRF